MSNLFKRAAVRGMAHELVARGAAQFPTKEAMDAAADAVADGPAAAPMPEASPDQGHDPHQVVAVAQKLIAIGEALMQQASGGGAPGEMPSGAEGGPLPMGPEAAAQGAGEVQKESASNAPEDIASQHAVELMKMAAEEKAANKLVGLGDHANTPQAAAKTDGLAELDLKNRADGKYHEGVGNTQHKSVQTSGQLEKYPELPTVTVSGSNSITEDIGKHAAYAEMRKIANKLVGLHGANPNTPEAAAEHDTTADLDLKHRKPKEYLVGIGGANKGTPQEARIGYESPASKTIGSKRVEGSNSVTQVSKPSETKVAGLSVEEKALVTVFQKTAADVGEYLPAMLTDDEKVAAIQSMVFLDHAGRQDALNKLHEKISSGMPAALLDLKKDEQCEKKEEKKEEEPKTATLMDNLKKIAAASSKK